MGLDMYLRGRAYKKSMEREKDGSGFDVSEVTYALAYWRKNHWLHGFICNQFADDVDDCNEIALGAEDLELIVSRLRQWLEDPEALTASEGFFFGEQDSAWRDECREKCARQIPTIEKAIEWLEADQAHEWRSVEYQASW